MIPEPAYREGSTAARSRYPPALQALPTVTLHGARFHAITEQQCVDIILDELSNGRGGSVATMNLDSLRWFAQIEEYRVTTWRTSIITADGMPLIWASRLQGTPLPERVTGSSLIWTLNAAAAARGRSIYLLGGAPGTAQRTAVALKRRYPELRIAGVSSRPDPGVPGEEEWASIGDEIRRAHPDIVYVGLGAPKRERLIERLSPTLPAAWWLGVGFAFSFASGDARRAPLWMQRVGLEWFHRLAHEPRRLAGRYLGHDLPFALVLFGSTLAGRFFGKVQIGDPQLARNPFQPQLKTDCCRLHSSVPQPGISARRHFGQW
jgi:N-acetylglucosaminyldiphosphoundecaprenol N-acetyl-beta-D-mannosaminyltransferase